MTERIQREEKLAAQERDVSARDSAGSLTDMFSRTYRKRSLFGTGRMTGVPMLAPPPPQATAPAVEINRPRPVTTPVGDSRGAYSSGPGQRPITNHSAYGAPKTSPRPKMRP